MRLNPRRGWGVAAALNWFNADLKRPGGGDEPFARLTVRPLMAGIGYTFGPDRTLFNVSVVAGPSFNSVKFDDEFIERISSQPTIEADNSLAIRPGFSITHTLAPRVALTGFTGYMFNRAKIVHRNVGTEFDDWNADSFVLSVGVVYSISLDGCPLGRQSNRPRRSRHRGAFRRGLGNIRRPVRLLTGGQRTGKPNFLVLL